MVVWHLDVIQDVFFAGLFLDAEYEVPSDRNMNSGTANKITASARIFLCLIIPPVYTTVIDFFKKKNSIQTNSV
jgi:hypothetical protein